MSSMLWRLGGGTRRPWVAHCHLGVTGRAQRRGVTNIIWYQKQELPKGDAEAIQLWFVIDPFQKKISRISIVRTSHQLSWRFLWKKTNLNSPFVPRALTGSSICTLHVTGNPFSKITWIREDAGDVLSRNEELTFSAFHRSQAANRQCLLQRGEETHSWEQKHHSTTRRRTATPSSRKKSKFCGGSFCALWSLRALVESAETSWLIQVLKAT